PTGSELPLDDGNACTDDSCDPSTGVAHQFNATTCPPPQTATEPSNLTVPTDFNSSTSFLYSCDTYCQQHGLSVIQRGFTATIDSAHPGAVIRGRVIDRDGGLGTNATPLPNVTVSILGHPEYGW